MELQIFYSTILIGYIAIWIILLISGIVLLIRDIVKNQDSPYSGGTMLFLS